MDTSKEYILMCEKAEEIQKYLPTIHAWYAFLNYSKRWVAVYWEDIPQMPTRIVWLPRQDQLQEMMERDISYLMESFIEYFNAIHVVGSDVYARINSMEKLWLTFTMKEKFNKVWNGEAWQIRK